MVKSAEAREYRVLCAELARLSGAKRTSQPVIVHVEVQRPRKAGDLDNRLKAVLDALNGVAYDDDEQIVQIVATRTDKRGDGCVLVSVWEVLQ